MKKYINGKVQSLRWSYGRKYLYCHRWLRRGNAFSRVSLSVLFELYFWKSWPRNFIFAMQRYICGIFILNSYIKIISPRTKSFSACAVRGWSAFDWKAILFSLDTSIPMWHNAALSEVIASVKLSPFSRTDTPHECDRQTNGQTELP